MRDSWKIELLKDTSEVFTDGDWIETKDQSLEGIRLVQTGNIGFGCFENKQDKARFISEETFKKLKCTEVIEGDLLVSRLPDPVGKSCIIPDLDTKMITGVDCTIIRTKKYLLPEYLRFYQMSNNYLSDVKQRVTGTTRSRISRKNLGLIEIPIPPIEEQKEIVEILDQAFESIDKAKANIEKNIENAKELFQSKLNQIFSQNVEGWETKKFLDCLNKVKNTIKIPKCKFLNDGLYPIVSQESSLISGYWDNMNDLLNVEKPVIIFGDHTKAIKFIDFSFVRGADGIKVLLPIEQINSKFFYYLLRSVKLRDLGYARHYRLLKELVISYPTIEKQKKIVESLDIIDNHIQSLLASYEEELKNLEELKKSILQKAFSGELTNKNKAA